MRTLPPGWWILLGYLIGAAVTHRTNNYGEDERRWYDYLGVTIITIIMWVMIMGFSTLCGHVLRWAF